MTIYSHGSYLLFMVVKQPFSILLSSNILKIYIYIRSFVNVFLLFSRKLSSH